MGLLNLIFGISGMVERDLNSDENRGMSRRNFGKALATLVAGAAGSKCSQYHGKYQIEDAMNKNIKRMQNPEEYLREELNKLFDTIAETDGTRLNKQKENHPQLLYEKREEFVNVRNYYGYVRDNIIPNSLGASDDDAQKIFKQAEDVGFILNPEADFCYNLGEDLREKVVYDARSSLLKEYGPHLTLQRQGADYCLAPKVEQTRLEKKLLDIVLNDAAETAASVYISSNERAEELINYSKEKYDWTYETSEVLGPQRDFVERLMETLEEKAREQAEECNYSKRGTSGVGNYLSGMERISAIYELELESEIMNLKIELAPVLTKNCLN